MLKPATHRVSLVLAARAAEGDRLIDTCYSSPDGRLFTRVRADDEDLLLLTVGASEPIGLARVGWTVISADGVEPIRWLVTPLAPARGGFRAEYGIAVRSDIVALDVVPATEIGGDAVAGGEVEQAFDLVQYGSARRAWLLAVATGALPGPVLALARRRLQP